ncbi:MAG TPA: cellulase family glycosylhydrolase [Chloroflexota bacterium]|nr:cellulase family glycosylhydrolase [Chloroflexota bacterium]
MQGTGGRKPGRYVALSLVAIVLLIAQVVPLASLRTGSVMASTTTLFSDNFEQDKPNTVPAGWTVAGGTWTVRNDGTRVASETSDLSTVKELVAGSSAWTNYTVQTDLKVTGSTTPSVGIAARRQNVGNGYQFLLKQGDAWFLGKQVNGVWTTLGAGTYNYTLNTWYTFKLTLNGTWLTASINGTQLISTSDSTFASGGISLRLSGSGEFDNVLVTAAGTVETPQPSPTATVDPPSPTATIDPPSPTATLDPPSPTPTKTAASPTPTKTSVTPTSTPVPPTPTATKTGPTATPTKTPVAPTATATTVPPTATAVPPTATPVTPTAIPSPVAGAGIHVQGNQLVTGSGQPIRLLGANHSGTEFECDQGSTVPYGWGIGDHTFTSSDVAALRSWGINAVRIPLNEDCWLGINNVNPLYGGINYQDYIQQEVRTLEAGGVYPILDLHWTSPGSFQAIGQQPLPDEDHSVAFWQSVAQMFGSDPNAIFDLFNEPFIYGSDTNTSDPWGCWLNGCAFFSAYTTTGTRFAYNWQSAGMQQLVNTIRAAGAKNLIMVGGLDWANDLSGWMSHEPNDPAHNLAVAWHNYPGEGCSTSTCWDSVVAPIASTLPIITGETGDNVCSSAGWIGPFLNWADAHNLSYLGWTWNTWSDCQDVLITSYSGTPTSNYGQAFQAHLLSVTGGPPAPTPLPTGAPTATSVPTSIPTNTPLPTGVPTNTPVPTGTPTKTPLPTATSTMAAPTATSTVASTTPTPTPTGFPVTSASLKNKAGINIEPSLRPWHYAGAAPDGWFCHDGVDCYVDPNNPYQVQGITNMVDQEMKLAASLGVATLRVEFPWPLIETSRGVYDWSRTDFIVREANQYGLQLQPILDFTPQWASSGDSTNYWKMPPTSTSDWSSFVSAIVNRYKNSVHYWELWDEPDGGNYWWSNTGSGVQQFAQSIAAPGYSAIKSADSTAKVIVDSSYADTAWWSSFVSYGGLNSFDILSVHDYANTPLSSVQTMQSWLNGQGIGSRPIWIGEYGLDQGSNTTNDTSHTTLIQTVLNGSGYQQAQFYELRDDYAANCCPVSNLSGKYWGIVQHDDVTLNAGYSLMQSMLGGTTIGSTVNGSPGVTTGATSTQRIVGMRPMLARSTNPQDTSGAALVTLTRMVWWFDPLRAHRAAAPARVHSVGRVISRLPFAE